jgi:predicted nucleic acid binding AN1-type Zn finger protein
LYFSDYLPGLNRHRLDHTASILFKGKLPFRLGETSGVNSKLHFKEPDHAFTGLYGSDDAMQLWNGAEFPGGAAYQ